MSLAIRNIKLVVILSERGPKRLSVPGWSLGVVSRRTCICPFAIFQTKFRDRPSVKRVKFCTVRCEFERNLLSNTVRLYSMLQNSPGKARSVRAQLYSMLRNSPGKARSVRARLESCRKGRYKPPALAAALPFSHPILHERIHRKLLCRSRAQVSRPFAKDAKGRGTESFRRPAS